jgi:hypothetical protein
MGEVRGADGRLVAEGRGRYLGATPAQKAELKARYGGRMTTYATYATHATTAGTRFGGD